MTYGELGTGTALTATNGRFPVKITRVIASGNHDEYNQYDARYGVVVRHAAANGVQTYFSSDEFGRLTAETRPDGMTAIHRAWCTTQTCPSGGMMKTVTFTDGAPPSSVIVDLLGREFTSAQLGFNGLAVISTTEYDNKGRISAQSRPHYDGDLPCGTTVCKTTFTYDALGRVETETTPGESGNVVTTTDYLAGGTSGGVPYATEIKTTNAKGQVRRELYNARGELIEAIDAAGTTDQSFTRYTYDVFGNLLTATVNANAATQVVNTYDVRGRKLTMHDPDAAPGSGELSYLYTAFGDEIRQQTDAKGQVTQFTYDALGRVTQRVDAFGTANAVTTDFTFDTATVGKGQLASTSTSEGETKTFTYNSAGKPETTTTTITGQGSYTTRLDFEPSTGRLSKITYPESTAFPAGLRVRYDFNAYGYLKEVRNDNAGPTYNTLYWSADELTAEGQLKKATFGNNVTTEYAYVPQTGAIDAIRSRLGTSGPYSLQNYEYDFDVLGNLTRRADLNQNVSEQLSSADSYDALNRVTTVRRYSDTTLVSTKTVAYDALGNVTSKSALAGTTTGTYSYTTAATCSGVSGAVNSGPHAVKRIVVGSTTRHFCYDGNGNLLSGWNFASGRTHTLTWTPDNKPKTVTENGQTLTFSYGADRSRFKQVNAFTGETRLYVDGLYEKETVGATVTHVHYILAGGEPVAIYKSRSDGIQETRYLHRDHLGNITEITDEAGLLADSLSYDVWGKRRNPDWSDATGPLYPNETPRGYTGHEHLDDVGLIHMNGRVYDPNIGRMLSPDPYVQFAGYSQSFNRYSYVLNNSLAFTDPSGYCIAAGPSCPTAGFGGFNRGYGGAPSTGRNAQLGQLNMLLLRVITIEFGFSTSWGSGYGGGCSFGANTCGGSDPIIYERGGSSVDPNIWGWDLYIRVRYFAYFGAPRLSPNNQETGRHKPALYQENYAGPRESPALDGQGVPNGGAPQRGVWGAVKGAWGAVIDFLGTPISDPIPRFTPNWGYNLLVRVLWERPGLD